MVHHVVCHVIHWLEKLKTMSMEFRYSSQLAMRHRHSYEINHSRYRAISDTNWITLHYLYQNMSLEYYVRMGSVDIYLFTNNVFLHHSTVYHYSLLHTIRKSQTQIWLAMKPKNLNVSEYWYPYACTDNAPVHPEVTYYHLTIQRIVATWLQL